MNDKTSRHPKKQLLIVISLIMGAIAIGFAPIFVRESGVGPFAAGFWRLSLALPFLLLLSCNELKNQKECGLPRLGDYGWLLLAGMFIGGDLATWHLSIHYTTVANATVLNNCTPVIIALWGWLILRHPVKKNLILGLVLTLTGIILLVRPSFDMSTQTMLGNTYGLVSAFFYAGCLIAINHSRKKIGTWTSLFLCTLAGAVTLFFVILFSTETFTIPNLTAWSMLIGLALICHLLGQGLITYALPHLPMTFSSAALLIQPIVATIAGWFLFTETLSLLQIAGIMIALTGMYLIKKIPVQRGI